LRFNKMSLLCWYHLIVAKRPRKGIADDTERGDRRWKEAQRQGYFTDNSIIGEFFSNKPPNTAWFQAFARLCNQHLLMYTTMTHQAFQATLSTFTNCKYQHHVV
jgi:hypothetical protein